LILDHQSEFLALSRDFPFGGQPIAWSRIADLRDQVMNGRPWILPVLLMQALAVRFRKFKCL
jgi:hypothetical protein